jgi:uncharacterized membrane protein YuzA (DUF378 family)
MTTTDWAVVLVAGILGVIPIDSRLAWGLLGIYALLKLLKVI